MTLIAPIVESAQSQGQGTDRGPLIRGTEVRHWQ